MIYDQEILSEPSLKNLTLSDYGKPPAKQNELLLTLGTPHINSFDFMLDKGLNLAVKDILPIEFELNSGKRLKLQLLNVSIEKPTVPSSIKSGGKSYFYPTEARQRRSTYNAGLKITVSWSLDGKTQNPFQKEIGRVPIMLKSKLCPLRNASPAELISKGEHADEWGGYFVVGGHEKLIRMLIMNRRNFPIAIKRNGWKNRGFLFSDIGVYIRSVKTDESSRNNVLHYVTNGSARLMFTHNKSMYFAPVLLLVKCLVDKSDEYIFQHLVRGNKGDQYVKVCLLSMMQSLHEEGIHNQADAKNFVGKIFKEKLYELKNATEIEVCDFILKNTILPHLDDYFDKFLCISLMTRKLFAVVQGTVKTDSEDSIMLHEILTGGSLYLQLMKDKLYTTLYTAKNNILKKDKPGGTIKQADIFNAFTSGIDVGMTNFLATGNVSSGRYSNLNLMQSSGFVIMAENINRMRYMSHYRAIHRGSYFQEMRSSEPRQLRTDAWGFICPVHTPDGTPCGLLNHLTKNCQISTYVSEEEIDKIPPLLVSLGMLSLTSVIQSIPEDALTVMIDGRIIGYVMEQIAVSLVPKLRVLKISGEKVPKSLEIVYLKKEKKGIGLYPGLYLFTGPGRMLRPVINLAAGEIELIGTFEQVYLDICITMKEAYPGITTHKELSKTDFLSNLANLIPMPDCNQSPRNMYQCQMGKQTMGTPCLNWKHQGEVKLYRLQTPATPFFRPVHYDNLDMDNFPMGTNAIVAVISYTGYDMEDAMIINKSSYERGFAHGCIFKSMFIELESAKDYFGRDPINTSLEDKLGTDGLVFIGAKIKEYDPLYCYWKESENRYSVVKYKGKEEITIEVVRMSSGFSNSGGLTPNCAYIGYRIQRNPTVGDKFASRAGQKGICSVKWPAEDLPFTESGLVPDIVFNPHGFPSRMTIAMMIECMAGKSAAVHGLVHDATPFKFTEENTAIDYFGKLLEAGGYNYYGTETMYSGVDGSIMKAQIFFGIVHYQRLRHMVSDKWQVRCKGPVDKITHQPVKGRKRGGGVRFGEMERDGVLAHGASWVLLDRLFNSSDRSQELVCRTCGSLIGPTVIIETLDYLSKNKFQDDDSKVICKQCGDNANIGYIKIPFVLRHLVCQLASFNIKVELNLKENDSIV